MLDQKKSILVIIDVQGKLARIMHNNDKLFTNLHILVSGMKLLNIPIIWMEQLPDKLGSTIPEIKNVLIDQKPIIKDVISCMKNDEFNNHNVHIVVDAISSRTSENKELGIQRMLLEGVMQTSVEMLLFELQGNAKGERFRQISKLVK